MTKKTLHTFSDNKLNFVVPDAWEKLTQQQLRYVYYAMLNYDNDSAKVYILVRLLGLKVIKSYTKGWECETKLADGRYIGFKLPTWRIQSFKETIGFIDYISNVPVRIEHIDKCEAVDARLQGVTFFDYLQLENYFQGFLIDKKDERLISMAELLYRGEHGNNAVFKHISQVELLNVFKWYEAVKTLFSKTFSYFFAPCNGEEGNERPDMLSVMNSEIRALTGGDITKEDEIFNKDCWRALTELNEKARETQEFNDKYGQH